MKKLLFPLAAAAAATAVACSVENVVENQTPAGETFTIEAAIATAPESKTTLTVIDDKYKVEWDENEELSVVTKDSDGGSSGCKFTKGDGNSFSGTVSDPAKITDIYVLYPYDERHNSYNDRHDNVNGFITIGSAANGAQTQTGIDNTEHVKGNLYGYSQVSGGTASVTMYHAATLFEVIVKNSADKDISISRITLGNSENDPMVGTYYIQPQTGSIQPSGEEYVSPAATLAVSGENTIASGSSGKFYIVSAPFELATGETLSVKIVSPDGASYDIDKVIPSADFGKFAAGTVNHIQAEISEIKEGETIADGEYLIAGYAKSGWAVMTATNQKSEYFDAERLSMTKPVEEISCSDFYSVPAIPDYVWTVANADGGYSIQSKTTSKYLSISSDNVKESDAQDILSIYKNEDGTYTITKDGKNVLKYNTSSPRFKPYLSTNDFPMVVLIPWIEDTAPRIFVTETSKTVNYDATSVEFEYSTRNIAGPVTATETDPDNIISAISTENNVIAVTLTPNTEEKEKNASIELSYTGAESVTLNIKQNAVPGASSKYYVKVTSEPADWSGQYLIVFEEVGRIYKGSLTSNFEGSQDIVNYYDVNIMSDQILSTSEIDDNCVFIENHAGAYAIKTASGYYISKNDDKNGVDSDTEYSSDCNITFTMDGTNVKIAGNGSRIFLYNGTNDPNYIRFYSSSNWSNSGYTKPSLYRLQ